MIRAVLFDLDETLFDHRYAARCVLKEWQSRHASLQAHPLSFLEDSDFRILGEKHALVMAGVIDIDDWRIERIQSLFALCGETISREQASELALTRQQIYRKNWRAVPGALELLALIKPQAKIGIVTNNFIQEQQGKIAACGLAPLIDVMVTSEEMERGKPHPEIFQAALDRLGRHANEAVMIGDSWEVDVLGAINAGIRPIWFNRDRSAKPGTQDVLEISSLEPASVIAQQILGGLER